MRTKEEILKYIEEMNKEYAEKFNDEPYSEEELYSVYMRTYNKQSTELGKKTLFFDKKMMDADFSLEELKLWGSVHEENNLKRELRAFELAIQENDFELACEIITNNKYKLSTEQKEEMVQKLGPTYCIDILGNVNTIHAAKKLKKQFGKYEKKEQS